LAGGAVLAVLAVTGGSVMQQVATVDPKGNAAVADRMLDGPDGTRLVGMGRAVVAVPSSWSTGETRCLKPVGDTVYAESGAMTDCSDEPTPDELSAASSLAVSSGENNYGFVRMDDMAPAGTVDGADVLEAEVVCRADDLPPACSQEFAVPSEMVAFRVTVSGVDAEAGVVAIRASLRILPEGYTAVPLSFGQFGDTPWKGMPAAYVEKLAVAIERAGLRVRLVEEYRDGMTTGSYLYAEPALGTPLEVGATVTLTVSAGREPATVNDTRRRQ
jgi:hypothetical protein